MTDVDARPATGMRYRLLLDLAREVTAQRDLSAVLDQTFVALRKVLDFTGGSIALVDDDGWISFAATDPPATPEAMAMRIRVGDGIVGRIVADGEPEYVADIYTHPNVTPERRAKSVSAGVVAWFGVPLITEGRAIGVLQIDSPRRDAWSEDDRLLLMSFTPIVAAAVQNARVYAREHAALRRLEELDQRHRDFVAIVSHELRTPLTAVIGYCDTVLTYRQSLDQETMLGLIERSRASAARLAALVEELLDLSVIQRGELRLSLAPVDVPSLLGEAVSQFAPAGRTVAIELADGIPAVLTDAARLTQVVGNLVTNAAKFSPDDTPIEIGARCDRDALELRVRDHGIGIPDQDRDRVFDRFVQLERANVRRAGGIGVGLYIVRQLCDALGATVHVESEVGAGSTFVVRVPLRPAMEIVAQRS
ncbi:MAG TPA: ATP-binding protein [Frankiaceae bacterium]|nr:ATP-binding protein [Frankiaceae bacterium]